MIWREPIFIQDQMQRDYSLAVTNYVLLKYRRMTCRIVLNEFYKVVNLQSCCFKSYFCSHLLSKEPEGFIALN